MTTSLRDSVLWESGNGITAHWAAMGDGTVDWKAYFDRFTVLCPGVPVHIETISGINREFATLDPAFWKLYPDARASDFARYLARAKRGKARPPYKAPAGKDRGAVGSAVPEERDREEPAVLQGGARAGATGVSGAVTPRRHGMMRGMMRGCR